MNTSGEAADQLVRMALQTGEVALKITGAGAKQLAVLIYAILKNQKKTKGRARLETLVRTGKPLTVFSVKERDVKEFTKEAKQYGVLYCAVRNRRGSKDGMVDLIVKEEDASRINRIVERFKFSSVKEVAQIKSESGPFTEKGRSDLSRTGQVEPDHGIPGKSDADKQVGKGMGVPVQQEGEKTASPFPAKTEKSHLSEPISGRRSKTVEGTSKSADIQKRVKPSVRQELKEIQERKKEPSSKNRQKPVQHRQPARKKKIRAR